MPVKNVCHCVNPPGGHGQCEPDQLATCRARGDVCISVCDDPPKDAASLDELYAWALSKITGQDRRHFMPLSQRALQVLAAGIYINPDTREAVTFVLPQSWGKPRGPGSSSTPGAPGASGGAIFKQTVGA